MAPNIGWELILHSNQKILGMHTTFNEHLVISIEKRRQNEWFYFENLNYRMENHMKLPDKVLAVK